MDRQDFNLFLYIQKHANMLSLSRYSSLEIMEHMVVSRIFDEMSKSKITHFSCLFNSFLSYVHQNRFSPICRGLFGHYIFCKT